MVTHPALTFVAGTSIVLASMLSTLSPSDVLLVIGAIGFALSTVRSGRMKILRETNDDLKTRNDQLETAATHMLSELHKKDAEILLLERRPNLDSHEKLLVKLLDRLENHDKNMTDAAKQSQEVFHAIVDELKILHQAVVPPTHPID